MATIIGTNATETITGTLDDDRIEGLAGNDTITGSAGDDEILGQGGNDSINGGDGSDDIFGGSGNDTLRGDAPAVAAGNQTDTDSGTLVNGNAVTVSLTAPTVSGAATGTLSGFIGQTLATASVNVAFVIDVSGSMTANFSGSVTVPDLNGDGLTNTLLDGAIASYQTLNAAIIAAGFGSAEVRVIAFADDAAVIGTASASADSDSDGESDISELLRSLQALNLTNFEAGLQQSVTFFNGQPSGDGNYLYFLSDGFPTAGGAISDEIASLQALGVVRTAIGLGSGSSLTDLNPISSDGTAEQVLNPNALTASLIAPPVPATAVTNVQIRVNGGLVQTILGSALVATPFGLTYTVNVPFVVGATDAVTATVNFADGTSVVNALSVAEPEVGDDYIDGGSGLDTIFGGAGDDDLRGEADNDTIAGDLGEDRLWGGSGNDRLEGGAQNDEIDGGSGIDTAVYTNATALVTVDLLLGTARGGDGFDTLRSIESVEGSAFNDTILGNEEVNRLVGGAGGDRLDGGDGNDTLLGGLGVDTLTGGLGLDSLDGGQDGDVYFADNTDSITDTGTLGRDRVVTTANTYTLAVGNGVEDLFADDFAVVASLTGNELGNQVRGNEGANLLRGLGGNDILTGAGGIDRLDGGTGRDSMTGGTGADTFIFRSGDTFATAVGFDTINDFGTGDKIDLDFITAGVLPVAQYAEVVSASPIFANLLAAAQAQVGDGTKRVVFVAGPTDGWLFWSQDTTFTTIEASVRLTGVNTLAGFSNADLI